jgi:hypothetical protein
MKGETMGSIKRATAAAAMIAAGMLLCVPARAEFNLIGPNGHEFDIQDTTNGQLMDGSNDAYDSAYYLTVNGTQYTSGGTAGTSIIGGRGVRMAAQTSGSLLVQREAYVPATGSHDYIRYFDTVENTSGATVTVTVTYSGGLGSDTSTIVTATSSGDTTVSTADFWYCTDDTLSDPALGHVWWGESAGVAPSTLSLSSDAMTTTFSFDLPGGARAAFVIFAVQANDAVGSQLAAVWLSEFPPDSQEGLEGDQIIDIVNWNVAGAPAVRFEDEDLVVEEGGELEITVTVEDPEGDPVTVGWDLDGDEDYGDATGLTVVFSAVGIDGPSSTEVGVRATDGTNERIRRKPVTVENVPPEFVSSPGEGAALELHRGEDWSYQVEVQDQANTDMPPDGLLDPLVVTVSQKPTGMIFTADLALTWEVPRTDAIVGEHTVSLGCSDGDGGNATQEFVLNVLENAPPTRPVIVSPSEETVTTPRPTLTIENSEDPDGDQLSYMFQIATVGTFTADAIVSYSTVSQNPSGQTAWTVNADLEDGTRYYWRVWAKDDKEDGPAVSTFFDVDLSEMVSEDADTADVPGDVIGDFIYEDKADACSCTAAGRPGGAGGGAMLLLAFALFLGLVLGRPACRAALKGRRRT